MAAKEKKLAKAEAKANDKAQELIDTRKKIAELQEKEEAIIKDLRDYVKETGAKDIGNLTAYDRMGVAKFEGLDNKALDVAKEQLINELSDTYVTQKLDINKIYAALATDKALLGHLTAKGLTVVATSNIYFKEKK